MKNILLTLMVFGSFGAFADCSSEYLKTTDVFEFRMCNQTELRNIDKNFNNNQPIEVSSLSKSNFENVVLIESYEALTSSYVYGTERKKGQTLKAEAMNISSGAKIYVGNFHDNYLRTWIVDLCELETGSKCLLSRYLDEVYYLDLEDYKIKKAEEELKFQEYHKKRMAEKEALKEQRKQWAEEERKAKFLDLECKLGKNLDEESKPIKIRIEIKKSKNEEYYGNVWYPKSTAPPFHRGYISGNTVRYKFESISVNDKEITGGVDMNFASFYVLTINRYSGSIEADGGGDYWSRTGECIALEEQKF